MIALLLNDVPFEQDIRELFMAYYPGEKYVRDEESARIIDLIFENITFELCSTMGFNQLYSVCQKYLCGLSNEEITTSYADIRQAVEKAIANAVDTYAANEEKFG